MRLWLFCVLMLSGCVTLPDLAANAHAVLLAQCISPSGEYVMISTADGATYEVRGDWLLTLAYLSDVRQVNSIEGQWAYILKLPGRMLYVYMGDRVQVVDPTGDCGSYSFDKTQFEIVMGLP